MWTYMYGHVHACVCVSADTCVPVVSADPGVMSILMIYDMNIDFSLHILQIKNIFMK